MAITKKNALKQLNNMGSNVSNQQSLNSKLAGPQIQNQFDMRNSWWKAFNRVYFTRSAPGTVWTWLRELDISEMSM